ncbi:phosphoribosyltransferase [Archangium minus]|uniref:Phosphoribosyltransferase n=1 Tax=Archangium minus TaxID=83450 RepID=A0ABY9X1C8_9BACT|nr:phosphoribosyltransferase [Archangium minus]
MALTVACFASYLTNVTKAWRDEDHSASMFIKAIKGKPFKGYGHVPVRGWNTRFDHNNRHVTHTFFGKMAADHLDDVGMTMVPLCLVPLPSSDAVQGTSFTRFPARDLALAVQRELAKKGETVQIDDILRWKMAKQPSHAGGTRDAQELYENLVLTAAPSEGVVHVLVDDVCTGGGHLRAAKRRLEDADATVDYAVCAGRTVQIQPKDAFAVITEKLPDLEDPWDF